MANGSTRRLGRDRTKHSVLVFLAFSKHDVWAIEEHSKHQMFVLLKEKLVQVSAQGRNTDLLSAYEIGAMIQAHLGQEKTGEVDGGMVGPTQSEGLNFAQGACSWCIELA